jgi:hypothetical protein
MYAAFRRDHEEMMAMPTATDEFDLDIRLDTVPGVIEIDACSDPETVGRPCISINASCHPWCQGTKNCG